MDKEIIIVKINPEIEPSHVFFGLITESGCLPKNLPAKYAAVSQVQIKMNIRITIFGNDELIKPLSSIKGNIMYAIPNTRIKGFIGSFPFRKISGAETAGMIIKTDNSKNFQSVYRIIINIIESIIPKYFKGAKPFFSNIEQNSHKARDEAMIEKIRKQIPPK